MELDIYQVDAFAKQVFEGNPAAVIPLKEWPADDLLLKIAQENNLSETAYFIDRGDHLHLRWFTPAKEVRLCGHATLASAHVLFEHLAYPKAQIHFKVLAGDLYVHKQQDIYTIDFPADQVQTTPHSKDQIEKIIGASILDLKQGTDDLLVQVESETVLNQIAPDFRAIAALDARGLIATTKGTQTDITSRCFYPAYGIDEDPVTGSAHTLLTCYWAAILGKTSFTAVQGSARKGFLHCQYDENRQRVKLGGPATTYLKGNIFV